MVSQYHLPENIAKHLAQEFGTDAPRVLETVSADVELAEPVYPGSAVLAGEVLYSIREEMAQNIEDVLARRTGIQVHSWKNAVAAAPLVGKLLGRELGWGKEATGNAIDDYISTVRHWRAESCGSSRYSHAYYRKLNDLMT